MIHSDTKRFLIGRDILNPLKFLLSDTGLQLTDPKTGRSAMYNFADVPTNINLLEDADPIVASATAAKPELPPVLKGDKKRRSSF